MAIETVDEAATGEAWYASRGVLASLATMLVGLFAARLSYKGIGINETERAGLTSLVLNLLLVVTGAVSWYGRVFAKRKISKQISIPVIKPPTPSVTVSNHDLEG